MATVNTLDFPPTLGSEVAQGRHYMLIDSYESTSATQQEVNYLLLDYIYPLVR